MDIIACGTVEMQRVAAGRRPWHAALALGLAGSGAAGLLAHLALAALHNGHPGTAGALLGLGLLAGALTLLASRRTMALLAWLLLGPHLARCQHAAAAAAASARMRALARHMGTLVRVTEIISTIISHLALPIINNRHLAHLALSQKLISQRPN
jgi:hypothetical protein